MTFRAFIVEKENGAVAIEYGLIAALISIAGIIAFITLGENVTGLYESISSRFCAGIIAYVPDCGA